VGLRGSGITAGGVLYIENILFDIRDVVFINNSALGNTIPAYGTSSLQTRSVIGGAVALNLARFSITNGGI